MVTELLGRGKRPFPGICINLRTKARSWQIFLTPAAQFAAVTTASVVCVALLYLCLSRIGDGRPVAFREAAAATVRDELPAATRNRDQVEAQHAALAARLGTIETDNPERQERYGQISTSQPVGIAPMVRLAGLVTSEPQPSQTDASPPELLISDAPPEPQSEAQRVAQIGHRAIAEFQRLLGSTGLNVGHLFPQFGEAHAEGGPFVAPSKHDQSTEISPNQLEAMRSLIRSLPLSVPLDQYQLESRFGPRRDPFNHRVSFHTGLDLSAPYMSPVYATAAGTVTYAGYWSDYGKVVEIDHRNGIATVYAHLHRYIVSEGQKVAEHEQIGFLGSTGRSSGPHLHYEIRVNDEPQDPEKFIGLSRLIPAANR